MFIPIQPENAKMKVSIVNRSPASSRGRENFNKLTNEIIAATISKESIETVIKDKKNFDHIRGNSNGFMISEDFSDSSFNYFGNSLDSSKQFPEFRAHLKSRSLGER